jgi:hypothetical protein
LAGWRDFYFGALFDFPEQPGVIRSADSVERIVMLRVFPKWLPVPSRIALLLGLGALSVSGAKAGTLAGDLRKDPGRLPQQSVKRFGELLVWSDRGRIYVSEPNKPAEELHLGDTTEARLLRDLLERDGATAASPRVLSDRIILVGGGGMGISWTNRQTPNTAAQPGAPAAAGSPQKAGTADNRHPSEHAREGGKTNLAGTENRK